ncbi:MAG: hypothetical protein QOJ42_3611 [Acidobacteriaceae bacterium]|nr:hypothetical protein [Acidobacteriaceae bacterium]MEA3007001.1 hypothetical protein [Acidobacteriaceae bacterium]
MASHISRKTSEMWGTQNLWSGQRLFGNEVLTQAMTVFRNPPAQ